MRTCYLKSIPPATTAGHKLNNDHKSLSYRPSSYFMRKANAFRPQRRILLQEISMTS